jgi:capsular exopolysaccharide synthesis family protein
MTRPIMAGLAGFVAFLAPVAFILLRDVRTKTVNSSEDVSLLSGVQVLGTVPLIPSQVIRLQSTTEAGRKRFKFWQAMLAESVNRVATGLLADTTEDAPKLILITSAVAGEGKTTLSTQLAMSLARAGRSVTIVDLDLRRPTIHQTFGMSNGPGISETLRGDIDLSKSVQATGTPNLSVVTAGKCDTATLRLLGHESTASLFKEIRGLSDFVVVDGCPVLPLADTGFICPHVDTVLFAVRRDVSLVGQVRAARDFIATCGNEVMGAVVTEGNAARLGDDRYYIQQQEEVS